MTFGDSPMHILDQPITNVFSLPKRQREALTKARLFTMRDILFLFPSTYADSIPRPINTLSPLTIKTVSGTIKRIANKRMFPKQTSYVEIIIGDATGTVRALWFNQPYVAKTLHVGNAIQVTGKIRQNKRRELYLINPVRESALVLEKLPSHILAPEQEHPTAIYSPPRGISSRSLSSLLQTILASLPIQLEDPLPNFIRKKFNLPSFGKALREIHIPSTTSWVRAAHKRFAFEEMFLLQLERQRARKRMEHTEAYTIPFDPSLIDEIESGLAFSLTRAQKEATKQILTNMNNPYPMARLLEGDVGSGKTLVAIIASHAVTRAGFQVAYMAPTEILARQHFKEFCEKLRPFRNSIGLVTSAECVIFPSKINPSKPTHIAKNQLLPWIENGKVGVTIGTHALLQESIRFKHMALAIIDEQHRFGIEQRQRITKNDKIPHLLSMSATPIPRTLALTLYGDLDLSLLDELPQGRKRPLTKIVPPAKRKDAYEFIRRNVAQGGQVFVICPKIEDKTADAISTESIVLDMKSVKAEYKKLSEEIFPDLCVGLLHGKMKPKEKEEAIKKFREKKTQVLVSTSVIEVGMDIPNASVMMIEGADRFGLASLHQFRGRVGRAGQQAYCFLFTDSQNSSTHARLRAFADAKNGFEIAELDLQLRGSGELTGKAQWGVSDMGMEALQNLKMVEAAREEAKKLIDEDPELTRYPLLQERVEQLEKRGMHFE
ncbi:MAG: ATP-dependent DNA helicase RecG [Parcubacteria group bacterium Gr01-1014_70]|nr:MAG: ATP-dependent DNA helicase RecG [Parcubacteria group bacterium Gr01-1014_70]